MAQTFADAFAAVDEERLDRAAGFVKEPPPSRPSMDVHPAWVGFQRRGFDRLVGILVHRDRAPEDLAEEALAGAFLEVLTKEPERFLDEPEDVLGLVLGYASKRVLRLQKARAGVRSLDHLLDMKIKPGGADEEQERWDLARPVVAYTKADVDEDARFTPPPSPGESWERHHLIGAVQRFRDEHGRAPKQREFTAANGLPSWGRARQLGFATVNDLLLEAGVPIETPNKRRAWKAVEAAEACYRFRRREGHWPSEADAVRLPPGALPRYAAMERFFGGTSEQAVQEGCERILGPIDRKHHSSGELTERLRRAMGFEGGLTQPRPA